MHCGSGSMAKEVRDAVSLLSLAALSNTQLLAGGSLGMAMVNILLHLRWMPFLERGLLTLTLMLMLMPTALLQSTHLPISQHKQLAAATAIYCRWALPQMLISSHTRPTPTTARASVEAVALHILFSWALAFGLSLRLEGVAMATCCSHLAAMVLSAHHHNELSLSLSGISLPTTTNSLSMPAPSEAEIEGNGMDQIWYDCIVLAASLLPLPLASVAAAAVMMRTASFLQALIGCFARYYAHLHVVLVCALGLAQGFLLLLAMQIAQYQWLHSIVANKHLTLYIIQQAMPTFEMWAVAACIQSSAWAYLCRSGGEGIMTVAARIRLLCMCVVGVPVSLMSCFLFGRGVEGLCHGMAAAQVTQAVAFTSLMFGHSAQMQTAVTVTANQAEVGSAEEDDVVESISNLEDHESFFSTNTDHITISVVEGGPPDHITLPVAEGGSPDLF